MYVLVLSVITGILGLYYFFFKDLNLFKKHGIPHIRPLPLVGNFGLTIVRMQSAADLVKNLYNMHSNAKYVGIYDMTRPVVMLRDLDLIKSVTLKHFASFPDHRSLVREDVDLLFSKSLFSLKGDNWREMRNILSPSFTPSKIKDIFKLISVYATDFAKFMAELPSDQKVVEAKDIFTKYAFDVIATCAFGISVDSIREPNNRFYRYSKESTVFGMSFVKFYLLSNLPWLAKILKLKFIRTEAAEFFQELVETTIKTRDEKGIVRQDMLQLIMENRSKKDKKDLTIEDITSQVFIFVLGGFDSIATLLCFAAHEIAVNEDIQKRLQDEIDQILEDMNGQVSYDVINNMEYMDAVLNEALRMYPVAVALDRECIRDFKLPPTLPGAKPYTIKKGQVIWIPVYGLQHDPKYFEEPEKFNPDRFLGEQKKHSMNTGAYFPFGLGPRMCIGNRFALMETKILFFHLLARCDLLPCEKTPMPLKLAKDNFTMNAEGGFWLKIVPKKNPHRTVTINNTSGTNDL